MAPLPPFLRTAPDKLSLLYKGTKINIKSSKFLCDSLPLVSPVFSHFVPTKIERVAYSVQPIDCGKKIFRTRFLRDINK